MNSLNENLTKVSEGDDDASEIMMMMNNMEDNVENFTDKVEEGHGKCGLPCCKPKWLQSCHGFGLLFICLLVYGLTCGAVGSFKSSQVTTLEKRFDWSSSQSGLVLAANDVGQMFCLFFLMYYGTYAHRPRLLALSSLVYGLAAIAQSSPHFIFGSLTSPSHFRNEKSNNGTSASYEQLTRHGYQLSTNITSQNSINEMTAEAQFDLQSKWALAIFLVAGFFEGMGSAPFFCIVFAFVDDMTGNLSGFFIGLLILLRLTSPTIGALFGAKVVNDLHESLQINSNQILDGVKDPKWIGAWWLGFLVFGLAAILISIPLAMFPRSVPLTVDGKKQSCWVKVLMNRLKSRKHERRDVQEPQKSLSKLWKSLSNIFRNPIFCCMTISNFFEFMEINMYVAYFMKYVEVYFRQSKAFAALSAGVSLSLGNALGIGTSALVAVIFPNWNKLQMARFWALTNVCGLLGSAVGYFFTCSEVMVKNIPQSGMQSFTCANSNFNYSCNKLVYNPVCANDQTFFSACTAGCQLAMGQNLTHCLCANGSPARLGLCQGACSSIYGFMIVLLLLKIVRLSSRSQETVLLMRCVRDEDKTVTLILQPLLFGLNGFWVAPVLGYVIQQACIMSRGGQASKSCLLYSSEKLNLSFVSFGFAAQCCAIIFVFASLYFVVREHRKELKRQVQHN